MPSSRLLCILSLAVALLPTAYLVAENNSNEAIEMRLKRDATVLASDKLKGRGLGTDGLNEAAEYIAAEFKRLGFKTDLFDGSPFQKFKVKTGSKLVGDDNNWLSLSAPESKDATRVAAGDTLTPLALGGSGTVEGEVAFVGYGITAPKLEFDEYADVDVKGKVVIMIRKEPQQQDKNSKLAGARSSQHAFFTTKINNAAKHGAAAVIMVNDELTLKQSRANASTTIEKATNAYLKAGLDYAKQKEAGKSPDPAKAADSLAKLAGLVEAARKRLDADHDQLITFTGAGDNENNPTMPVFFCKRAFVQEAIKKATGQSLSEIEAGIDKEFKPRSQLLKGWKVACDAKISREQTEIKNVIGVLEGEGPHAEETIVIGAHYDHLGMGGRGSLAPWTKEIHNGADDNASGTVTMLEIARHFAAQEKKPLRRIVFMAFTGEERGLWGSAHYTRNPRFALKDTIAMYNLDMVGRLTNNKLKLQGTGTAAEFDALVEDLNKKYKFALEKDPTGFGPSDHTSFYRAKVPVLHIFTGLHSDYHRPSDDVDKLNLDGMRKIAQFVEEIVQWTLDQDARPEYKEIRRARGGR